jgi:hypothetical protein
MPNGKRLISHDITTMSETRLRVILSHKGLIDLDSLLNRLHSRFKDYNL